MLFVDLLLKVSLLIVQAQIRIQKSFGNKKKKLDIPLASLHIFCGLWFGLQCTLNETLVRSDMQRHNYVSVVFCGLGADRLMGPPVLKQGRLTRSFKPVFIPPVHRG